MGVVHNNVTRIRYQPTVAITIVVMSSINIVIHALGCCLLRHLYRRGRRKTCQQLYLIGHSILVMFKNFVSVILVICDKFCQHQRPLIVEYFGILFGSVMYSCYASIFYITLDRLAGKYKKIPTIPGGPKKSIVFEKLQSVKILSIAFIPLIYYPIHQLRKMLTF